MRGICLLILFIGFRLTAQPIYTFSHLTTNDGLSNNTVLSINQDHLGRIWMATYDGLCVYDGIRMHIIHYEPKGTQQNLPKGIALDLKIDENNFVWVRYDNNQLIRILNQDGKCCYYTLPDSTLNSSVELFGSREAKLMVKADSTFYSYNANQDAFNKLEKNHYLINEWKNNELLKVKLQQQLLQQHPDIDIHNTQVDWDTDCALITTINSGVWYLPSLSSTQFIHYSKQSNDDEKIASNEVYAAFMDREQNLWIGTKDEGINIGRPNTSKVTVTNHYHSNDSTISMNTIRAMLQDNKGCLWLGTYNDGLLVGSGESFKKISLSKTKGDKWDWVRSIYQDDKGIIWVGTYDGLCCFKNGSHQITYFDSLSDETSRIYSFASDKNGNLLMGGWKGIQQFNPEEGSFNDYLEKANLPDINVRKLFFDSKGYLWIATEAQGVYQINYERSIIESHYTETSLGKQISSNSVFDINEDSKGNIWIGTFAGVNCIDSMGDVKLLPSLNKELPTTLIYKLYVDYAQQLWLSTSKCIAKYDINNQITRVFGENDGFSLNNYTEGAAFFDNESQIYFGGVGGLISFNPDNIKPDEVIPKLFSDNLVVDNQSQNSWQADSVYAFSYSTKAIELDLHAVLMNGLDNALIAWQLQPFDDTFHIQKGHLARVKYSDLPAGQYHLMAKVANADNFWSKTDTVLSFTIDKPFWYSFYFYLGAVAFVLILILVIVRIRYVNMRKQKEELEKLVAQRTDKIAKQKGDLQKAFSDLERKSDKVQAQRDQILAQHAHLLEMNTKYEEANLLKEKFFTNVSHDIRTPLTLISGPLSEILKDKTIHQPTKEKLHRMERNVNYIIQLLDQVLDKKSLELGGLKRIDTRGDLVDICRCVLNSFRDQVEINDQQLQFHSNQTFLFTNFDFDKLQQIIYNLLANAIKFTPPGGIIQCNLNIGQSHFQLEIIDNGIGMPKNRIEHIFDRYYQINKSSDSAPGSGIGLSMVKEFVSLLKGEVEVDSEMEKGSSFKLRFPFVNHFEEKESTNNAGIEVKESLDNHPDKNTILIVEDNVELQLYLVELLGVKYKVILTNNGLEAKQMLAKNKSVDLILSDWMMPEIDGISLCKYVKRKSQLSKIPFILLTALGDVENEKEGFTAGVDEFISKPFDPELLHLKINNLIKRSNQIEHSLKVEAIVQPAKSNESSYDEKLVRKINEILSAQTQNSDFNQQVLADELGVSQMQLYRKVKEHMQSTPNELIRSYRVKKAKALLSEVKFSVNEVSFMIGFNDPKYFSRCFTKEYGISPNAFRKQASEVEV